jgi:hypothetical protein
MTLKEKANELVDKFWKENTKGILFTDDFNPEREQRLLDKAKNLALIAVNEIIKAGKDVDEFADSYWYQIKQEIEKL